MPIFKKAQRKNYAIEALNLLSQYHFFLTPRQAEKLFGHVVSTLVENLEKIFLVTYYLSI